MSDDEENSEEDVECECDCETETKSIDIQIGNGGMMGGSSVAVSYDITDDDDNPVANAESVLEKAVSGIVAIETVSNDEDEDEELPEWIRKQIQ